MANLADKKALTLTAARAIVAAAEAEARRHNLNVTMTVVDDGGHLLHLARMDDTGLASVDVSIAKARAAVMFKRPTKFWEDAYASGKTRRAADRRRRAAAGRWHDRRRARRLGRLVGARRSGRGGRCRRARLSARDQRVAVSAGGPAA
jgi:hypothetical protein